MGTRGLTAVFFDGSYKIAQYGQWDHYPSGQGVTVLEFCREWLTDPVKLSQFCSQLAKCRFVTQEEIEAGYAKVKQETGHVETLPGFVSMDTSRAFNRLYPLLDRDHGAKILKIVAEGLAEKSHMNYTTMKEEVEYSIPLDDIALQDSSGFGGASLFCEYAYVIDLDAGKLEVYKGFNQNPVPETNRFFNASERDNGYYPVALWKEWSLDALPTKKEFLEALDESDDDE